MGNCFQAAKQGRNQNLNFDPIAVDDVAPQMPTTKNSTTTPSKHSISFDDDAVYHDILPDSQSPEGVPLKFKVDAKKQMQPGNDFNTDQTECIQLQKTIALSQQEEIERIQYKSTATPNFDNMPFVEHMSMKEADKLYVGELVDFRDESGKFIFAQITHKNENILKVQYKNANQQIVEYECNYNVEIHRLAKKHSISQRPCTTNKSFDNIDYIDINPVHSSHPGWKIGTIVQFDYSEYDNSKCQVQVEYQDDNNITHQYWTHFDNKNEVTMAFSKSCQKIVNNLDIDQTDAKSELNDDQKTTISELKQQYELVTIQQSKEQDKNKNYVFHKDGFIERNEGWWSGWVKRWMVLNGSMLQLFEDKTCVKIIDNFNLSQCIKVEKTENSNNEFVLYENVGSEPVEFRMIDIENIKEREQWIQCIHRAIGKDDGYPKHDPFFIQTEFSDRFNGELKCKFMQNNVYHAELMIYNEFPTHNDDSVIRIDLTCKDNNKDEDQKTEIKQSIVRLQSKCWSDFKQRRVNDEEYTINKPLKDIIYFCIDYQNQHPVYKEISANCRGFMIELSNFLGITYPNSYKFEPLLYKMSSKMSGSIVQNVSQNQIDSVVNEQDKKGETVIVTENQWKCSQCTFVNHIVLPYCEQCLSQKNE